MVGQDAVYETDLSVHTDIQGLPMLLEFPAAAQITHQFV